jgi:hypothetical protein
VATEAAAAALLGIREQKRPLGPVSSSSNQCWHNPSTLRLRTQTLVCDGGRQGAGHARFSRVNATGSPSLPRPPSRSISPPRGLNVMRGRVAGSHWWWAGVGLGTRCRRQPRAAERDTEKVRREFAKADIECSVVADARIEIPRADAGPVRRIRWCRHFPRMRGRRHRGAAVTERRGHASAVQKAPFSTRLGNVGEVERVGTWH